MNRDGCDDDDSRALYPGVMSGVGPYMYYIIMFSGLLLLLVAGAAHRRFRPSEFLFPFSNSRRKKKPQNNSNKS